MISPFFFLHMDHLAASCFFAFGICLLLLYPMSFYVNGVWFLVSLSNSAGERELDFISALVLGMNRKLCMSYRIRPDAVFEFRFHLVNRPKTPVSNNARKRTPKPNSPTQSPISNRIKEPQSKE